MMVAVVVVAAIVAMLLARLGAASVDHARADTAADAAALAAADVLARTGDASLAIAAARSIARANGATLERCSCTGDAAEVVVVRAGVRAVARAEIGQSVRNFRAVREVALHAV